MEPQPYDGNGTGQKLMEAVSRAMRTRKPVESTVNSFLLRLADKIGRHEDTLNRWYYGETAPDGAGYWLLAAELGPDFHSEVTTAMTGWTEAAEVERLKAQVEHMRGCMKAGLEERGA